MTDHMFDFLIHTEIHLAAAPATVWPYILDTNSWRREGYRLDRDRGTPGAIGERFRAVTDGEPDAFSYYVVNVELSPGRRRTIRLVAPDETLIGYASWVLAPVGEDTRLEYHTYCYIEHPRDSAGASMARGDILRSFAHRINHGLAALKQLIETTPPQTHRHDQ